MFVERYAKIENNKNNIEKEINANKKCIAELLDKINTAASEKSVIKYIESIDDMVLGTVGIIAGISMFTNPINMVIGAILIDDSINQLKN